LPAPAVAAVGCWRHCHCCRSHKLLSVWCKPMWGKNS
jgi:hypothetical protein